MVLNTNSKERILNFLLENKNELYSIRTISIECKINYKSAYNAIIALEKEKLIKIKTTKNTKFCYLTNEFSPILFKVEYERKMMFIKKKRFLTLLKNLEEIEYNYIALLFGSYVKDNENNDSDIDLLIITDHEKEINKKLKLLPLNIHATYFNINEFLIMAKSKEFSVVSECLNKNIILIGIEDYYRLLKNVINK